MTAIAWAIIFYAIINDKSIESAPDHIKNFAYGIATFAFMIIIILTIKDIFK